jgi:ComF family protein
MPQQRTYIVFHYTPPISDWIHAAKFGASFIHCRLLSQLLSHTLARRSTPWPQCILPIPLHPRRLRQRGYNQAIEIARPLCHRFDIPMDIRSLLRHRYNQPQSKLALKERKNNVRDSFQLQQPLAVSHIALLDDVSTSGNTLEAASRALLMQGPLELEYWCIAKPF